MSFLFKISYYLGLLAATATPLKIPENLSLSEMKTLACDQYHKSMNEILAEKKKKGDIDSFFLLFL